MKILYLSDDFPPKSYGGAGIIAWTDARALAARGHDVHVITTTENAKDAGIKKESGMTVHVLFSKYHPRWRHYVSLNNSRIVSKISEIINEFKPDIVHAHNVHTHISYKAIEVAMQKVPKVFLTAHDLMMVHYGKMTPTEDRRLSVFKMMRVYGFRVNPFRNIYIRHYIKNVTKIFTVSDAIKTVLEFNGISNVETLHNGIDVTEWEVDALELHTFKEMHGLLDKKVILFGGRLSSLKGSFALLRAFEIVLKEVRNAVLLFVGKEHLPVPAELSKNVVATGWIERDHMKNVYAASDVVVVPSLYIDPFPTINLEAMASRKPVIGTRYGGTPEALRDGETGYIIDPENTEVFVQKMRAILMNQDLAEKMGEAGYERVRTELSLEKHIDELLAWYTR